jgi:hypothetical protein
MLVLERLGSVVLWSGCLALGIVLAVGHLAFARVLARTRRAASTAAAP